MSSHAQPSSLAERVRQLEAIITDLRERIEQSATAEEILRRANAPRRPGAHTRRRDRHGLHIVPGVVAAALALAVRSRKVMAAAAITTLAGGAIAAPAVLPSGPAASAGQHAPAPTRAPTPRTAPDVTQTPPPAARKRRRLRHHRSVQASPSPTPSLPVPTVAASPLPSLPVPLPTVTIPVPDPTVTDPLPGLPGGLRRGRHVDIARLGEAYRGDSSTSSVRKPGPRLLAGNTTTW